MKTRTRQKIEVFCGIGLGMLVGMSIGYYYAAATAAAMIREGLK